MSCSRSSPCSITRCGVACHASEKASDHAPGPRAASKSPATSGPRSARAKTSNPLAAAPSTCTVMGFTARGRSRSHPPAPAMMGTETRRNGVACHAPSLRPKKVSICGRNRGPTTAMSRPSGRNRRCNQAGTRGTPLPPTTRRRPGLRETRVPATGSRSPPKAWLAPRGEPAVGLPCARAPAPRVRQGVP